MREPMARLKLVRNGRELGASGDDRLSTEERRVSPRHLPAAAQIRPKWQRRWASRLAATSGATSPLIVRAQRDRDRR